MCSRVVVLRGVCGGVLCGVVCLGGFSVGCCVVRVLW